MKTATAIWPEQRVGILSRLYFFYVWKLILRGYKNTFSLRDLWPAAESESSHKALADFSRRYNKVQTNFKTAPGFTLSLATFLSYWRLICSAIILTLSETLWSCLIILDIRWLIQYATNKKEPRAHGVIYIIVLFLAQGVASLCFRHKDHLVTLIGVRLRNSLACCIFRKALRLSPKSRRQISTGEIINLISVDAGQFIEQSIYIHYILSAPALFILGTCLLYHTVGNACWVGLVPYIINATSNCICGKYFQRVYKEQMTYKDSRLRLLTEVLRIIRVIKFYAWEGAFQKFIEKIRTKEIGLIRKIYSLNCANDISFCCTNLIACLVVFATYSLGFGHSLTPDVVFTSVAVFFFYLYRFGLLARCIFGATSIFSSFKRIDKFLAAEELDPYVEMKPSDKSDNMAVSIECGSFAWNQRADLKNMNAQFPRGQLIAIIGAVGSGKSSLLSAIAGEMYLISGKVQISGTLGYVPQQSWILNDTLRGNVLLNKPYDEKRYQRTIEACALGPDLADLPAGDLTEIGERGTNVSGGQKQRISLARAVYQDSSIYLLDDPLSAVDADVKSFLFSNVIGPTGLLKEKTRIFVTNSLEYLSQCDQVVVMDNGEILFRGSYKEIEYGTEYCSQSDATMKQDEESGRPSDCVKILEQALGKIVRAPSTAGKLTNEEVRLSGMVTWSAYKTYCKSGGLAYFLLWLVLATIAYSCNIAGVFWLREWSEDDTRFSDRTGVMVLGILVAIQVVSGGLYTICFIKFAKNTAESLHARLLSTVIRAPVTFFTTTPTGRILNRFGQDVYAIDTTVPTCYVFTLQNVAVTVLAAIPAVYAIPTILVLLIPSAILCYIFKKLYLSASRQCQRLEAVSRSPLFSQLHDVLDGPENIRIYCQERQFFEAFQKLLDANTSALMCNKICARWLSVHLDIIGIINVTGAAIIAILTPTITPALLGMTLSIMIQIIHSLILAIRQWCDTENEMIAVERVKEYTEMKTEDDGIKTAASIPANPKWPSRGHVKFIDYSMRYRNDLPFALKNINLEIRSGEKVGIIGRTGAGKSSLVACLFRLVEPASGKILIDSVDISTISLCHLRRHLTIIPQDPVLFSSTIRQNLDPFSEYSDSEIWKALELSALKKYVASTPDALDNVIDSEGSNLSLGQRQLLCLARALLRRPKILILDEATAHVDPETDRLIQSVIRERFAKCTVITIAHRLKTIMDYDHIALFENGRLVEHGPIKKLLTEENSKFRQLSLKSDL